MPDDFDLAWAWAVDDISGKQLCGALGIKVTNRASSYTWLARQFRLAAQLKKIVKK